MNRPIDPDHLSDLLERAAGPVEVAPPPLAALSRGCAGVRRRRAAGAVVTAAAAVVMVVGATTLLPTPGTDEVDPTTDPTTADPARPAVDERLVGLGRVAVAVPGPWGTNETRCGVPQSDTVVIDVTGVDLCLTTRPEGVDSVEVVAGRPPFDFVPDGVVEVDGIRAERQGTACQESDGGPTVCVATLHLPSEGVWVRAESSSGPEGVDRILDGVRILSDRVGVPGFSRIADRSPQGGSGERYAALLTREGLRAVIRGVSRPRLPPGYVLDATPAPGTVVEPGSTVVVTVVAEQ